MERLLRRTIAFTNSQMTVLKAKADELGISVADLVRRIVDEWRVK
jgi:hypothetical protein